MQDECRKEKNTNKYKKNLWSDSLPLFEPIFIDFVKSDSFGELIDKISSRNFLIYVQIHLLREYRIENEFRKKTIFKEWTSNRCLILLLLVIAQAIVESLDTYRRTRIWKGCNLYVCRAWENLSMSQIGSVDKVNTMKILSILGIIFLNTSYALCLLGWK